MFSARDAIEDRMAERVQPDTGLSETADEVPSARSNLHVVTEEEKSGATQFSIVRRHLAVIHTALRGQKLQQISPCARNILRRD